MSVDVENVEVNSVETPNTNMEVLEAPSTEMYFATPKEARIYYEKYGMQNGFWIRGRTSSRGRNRKNEVTSMLFICAKEGKYSSRAKNIGDEEQNGKSGKMNKKKRTRNCSTIKCECKAQMRINYDKWKSKWKVKFFSDDHNHLPVSPSKRMKMRPNRKVTDSVKNMAEVFHKENLKVCKVTSIFGGEQMGFGNRDLYNHLRDVRHRDLDGGDAQSVLTYFKNRQARNPQFFYAIQCDENGRATNFFWVDSRSRMAYHRFGDVVSFDTTYRTNKYAMPFAPFTGVNHHFQSIQFGCALLQDETEETFIWLFQTWLEAMGGHPPIAILTDQDLAMKGAIVKVFPNIRHRLCIWHIKKKFAEKMSRLYYKKSDFKKDVKKCLWSTYKKEDFEEKWLLLMKNYGLESNEWLQQMYNIREQWVPVYNRHIFFAGMNTTGRSEGINSFFNDFVNSKTNLREFVVNYEQALKKIVQNENDEDFESEHKIRIVKDNEYLLKHAAEVYTKNVFNKFKDEMNEVFNYKVEETKNVDELQTFVVSSKVHEFQKFTVTLDSQTKEGMCECQNFEFCGILCRHILKIFVRLDIDEIPDHFILSRWRQRANRFKITNSDGLMHDDGNEESETLRLSHLCQESTKLACLAASSNEGYKIYLEGLKDISNKLVKVCSHARPPNKEKDSLQSTEPSQVLLLDPNISQTKGRTRKNERLKGGLEMSLKKKRKCRLCGGFGHDTRTCSKNPTSKTNKALEMEAEYSSSGEEEYE